MWERSTGRRSSTTPPPPSTTPRATEGRGGAAALIGRTALALAILGSQLLVDPAAEAAFDRPKRLAVLVGAAVASVAALQLRRGPARSRSIAVVALVAAAVALSALVSPRREVALDSLRGLALMALLLPLGASALLDDGADRRLLAVFVLAAAVNAAASLLERAGVFSPFAVEAVAGRGGTGGLIGNEGQLAVVLALAATAAVGLLAATVVRWQRAGLAALVTLFLVTIVLNRNLTGVLAVGAGTAAILVLRDRRRAGIALAAIGVVALVAVAGVPPLRERAREMVRHARAGEWDDLTSNRLGPWAAAVEMVRERPLVGFGPGTFGAEFVPHRLAAEIRHRQRFVTQTITSSYRAAHCEPLQAVAEWGVPAGLTAVAAALVLLLGTLRAAAARPDAAGLVTAGVLVAASVAALTWFPLQHPSSMVPVLLAAGRAWRALG